MPLDALFVLIGAQPHTEWLAGTLERDLHGFLVTGRDLGPPRAAGEAGREPLPMETSLPGVFAVGDVRLNSAKRVASAVGEGAMAVRDVHEYLASAGANSGRRRGRLRRQAPARPRVTAGGGAKGLAAAGPAACGSGTRPSLADRKASPGGP